MKVKSLLVAAVLSIATISANAQAKFIAGDMGLNINLGVGNFDDADFDFDGYGWGEISTTQVSAGASFEYIILDGLLNGKASVGAGAQGGFGFGHENFWGKKFNYTRLRVATRGVFHYAALDMLDTYGGITIGADMNKASIKYENIKETEKHTSFVVAPFVGARYFFSDGFGVNVELAYDDFAYMGAGLTLKF